MLLSFFLAILPLLVVLVGIVYLQRTGWEMAIVGLLLTALLAVFYFHTQPSVVLWATVYGVLKSFGIGIAVLGTMLMIFLMKEAGALDTISKAVSQVAATPEEKALFIGIAFGSLVTSLGVVTPALFPPLLLAMGFSPFAAVAIAVLGYNATTSFALLSLPVTLPAEVWGFDAQLFTYKICLYLPVISTAISFGMLYLIGGKESIKKGWKLAVVIGLSIGLSALLFSALKTPVMLIGVLSGLTSMGAFVLYTKSWKRPSSGVDKRELLRALSPWILLITFAAIVSVPWVTSHLSSLLGVVNVRGEVVKDGPEVVHVFANKYIDFNVLTQVYLWIFIATILSIPILKLDREKIRRAGRVWLKRMWGPFIAYSLFFAISYVFAWSAMEITNGVLTKTGYYSDYNINLVVGSYLSQIFGTFYIYVAPFLGLFGAVVGGSETGSNVLFYKIQKTAAEDIGYGKESEFMTIYAAHANAGGIASAITPSKVNNATATIGAGREIESAVMRKNIVLVLLLTTLTGIMTALFLHLSI